MHKTHTSKDTKRNRMEALMRIQDGIKNLIVENQRRHAVNFCVQQHHYVVVYGHMMFDEESPANFEKIEIETTNILLHYQFVKF